MLGMELVAIQMHGPEGAEIHRIFAEGDPPRAGLHRKRFGGRRADGSLVLYDDPALAQARDYWRTAVLRCGKKLLNLKGTLGLRLVVCFPHPKCSLKRKSGKYELRAKTPDCSNLLKVCEDVLQEMGVVADDALFSSVSVTKMTGARAFALVEIMALEPEVEVRFTSGNRQD